MNFLCCYISGFLYTLSVSVQLMVCVFSSLYYKYLMRYVFCRQTTAQTPIQKAWWPITKQNNLNPGNTNTPKLPHTEMRKNSTTKNFKQHHIHKYRIKFKQSCPCNRLWRPIGLWDVEDPTFSRQLAHRCALCASCLHHWIQVNMEHMHSGTVPTCGNSIYRENLQIKSYTRRWEFGPKHVVYWNI
jgi:hypothetical protein